MRRLTPLMYWRKPQRRAEIALTSEADVRGRTGFEASDYRGGALAARSPAGAAGGTDERGGGGRI